MHYIRIIRSPTAGLIGWTAIAGSDTNILGILSTDATVIRFMSRLWNGETWPEAQIRPLILLIDCFIQVARPYQFSIRP
jgi:hypothetical protein